MNIEHFCQVFWLSFKNDTTKKKTVNTQSIEIKTPSGHVLLSNHFYITHDFFLLMIYSVLRLEIHLQL